MMRRLPVPWNKECEREEKTSEDRVQKTLKKPNKQK